MTMNQSKNPFAARTAPQPPPAPHVRTMTLDKITNGKVVRQPRLLMFGVPGIGKTSYAAGAPDPIFLPTEDGTAQLDVNRLPRPKTWLDVLDAVAELTDQEHSFRTLVIDTIDNLEPMLWEYICKRDGKVDIDAYGFQKGQKNVAPAEWRVLLSRLETMCTKRNMGVIFLGQESVVTFKNPEIGGDYSRFELSIDPRAGGILRQWCDAVLFAQYETFTDKDDRKRVRGIGSGARLVHTQRTAAYDAKNRYELPPRMPLDYSVFAEAVAAYSIAAPARLRERINALLTRTTDAELTDKVVASVQRAGDDAAQLARVYDRLLAVIGIGESEQQSGQQTDNEGASNE